MLRLHVSNMSCGGCVKGVTRAVQGIAAGSTVRADLAKREVVVSGAGDDGAVIAALQRAGFAAERIAA